jgi:hypothetical protein
MAPVAVPATIERALAAHDWSHMDVVRVRSDDDVRRFLVQRSGTVDSTGPQLLKERLHLAVNRLRPVDEPASEFL